MIGFWLAAVRGAGFAMVSCDPNDLVAPIHSEEIFTILEPAHHERCLTGDLEDVIALQRLYVTARITVNGPGSRRGWLEFTAAGQLCSDCAAGCRRPSGVQRRPRDDPTSGPHLRTGGGATAVTWFDSPSFLASCTVTDDASVALG